jgi:hypothetical protein
LVGSVVLAGGIPAAGAKQLRPVPAVA